MSKPCRIRVEDEGELNEVVEVLIKNGYLFFDNERISNKTDTIRFLNRFYSDNSSKIRWLFTGHAECSKIFGMSGEISVLNVMGNKIFDYEVITIEEFLNGNH